MNITTKFGAGDIVYAVHMCKAVPGGKIILNEEPPVTGYNGANQNQGHAEDIFIVSPYEIRNITVSLKKGYGTDIRYELSNGCIRYEKDIFASFDDATKYAMGLYEKSSKNYCESEGCGSADVLKDAICKRLQQSLKTVLSYDQLERFAEEFANATQGFVIREAWQDWKII